MITATQLLLEYNWLLSPRPGWVIIRGLPCCHSWKIQQRVCHILDVVLPLESFQSLQQAQSVSMEGKGSLSCCAIFTAAPSCACIFLGEVQGAALAHGSPEGEEV